MSVSLVNSCRHIIFKFKMLLKEFYVIIIIVEIIGKKGLRKFVDSRYLINTTVIVSNTYSISIYSSSFIC